VHFKDRLDNTDAYWDVQLSTCTNYLQTIK